MASGFRFQNTDLDSVFAPQHSGWAQAAATKFVDGSGNDLNLRYAVLSTGSAAAATKFLLSSGADLNTVFAAYGSTGVQVATQPSAISGSAAAGNPSGTVTSNTTSCTGTKGKGSYTYTWHIANGSGFTLTTPNSQTCGITGNVPAGQSVSGGIYCTISDGVTSVNTHTVSASLTNTTPAFQGAQHTYSSGSGTETVPTGATQVVIELWGLGGSGGYGSGSVNEHDATYGPGGQAGGYCRSLYSCVGGQTLNYSLTSVYQTNSQVTSGSLSITTMNADGGAQGSLTGLGTASGGNQSNVTGTLGGEGGTSPSSGQGGAGTVGVHEGAEGGGGDGGFQSTGIPGAGSNAFVSFYYPA